MQEKNDMFPCRNNEMNIFLQSFLFYFWKKKNKIVFSF